MNTFTLKTIKDQLVATASELEKAALYGATTADWNHCISIKNKLVKTHQEYVAARHELGYNLTNQYRDEVAEALDGAAVEMFNFMLRLEDAA